MGVKFALIPVLLIVALSGCTTTETTGNTASGSDTPGILGAIQTGDSNDINRQNDIYGAGFTEVRLTNYPSVKKDPVTYGDYVAWVDERNGNDDIYLKNLKTGEERVIASTEWKEFNPIITGRYVIYVREWGEWNPPLAGDIMAYDISEGKNVRLTCDKYSKTLIYASDNFVVFSTAPGKYYLDMGEGLKECNPDRAVKLKNLQKPEPRNIGDRWIEPGEIIEVKGDGPMYDFWNAPDGIVYSGSSGSDWQLVEDTQPPLPAIKIPCANLAGVVDDLLICNEGQGPASAYHLNGTKYKDIRWGYDLIDGQYALVRPSNYYNWVRGELPEKRESLEKCGIVGLSTEGSVLSDNKTIISALDYIYTGDCNTMMPKNCREYTASVLKVFDFSDNSCRLLYKSKYYLTEDYAVAGELPGKRQFDIYAGVGKGYFSIGYFKDNKIVWADSRHSKCNSDYSYCDIMTEIYYAKIQ